MGALLVKEEHRDKGYGQKIGYTAYDTLDKKFTTGFDVDSKLRSKYETLGFQTVWDTYVAMLSMSKVAMNLAEIELPSDVVAKPLHSVNLEKLLKYDSFVFRAPRQRLMKGWITMQGSFGWVAVNEKINEIVGYVVLKQVIRGAGTEIGLAMAPLFANNIQIARLLLKLAAENCLANEAVPNTKLELFHPVGDNCGEDSTQLMNELEAELTHIAYRMYTKGIPSGRQLRKIYGIASPTFD